MDRKSKMKYIIITILAILLGALISQIDIEKEYQFRVPIEVVGTVEYREV